MNKSIVTALKVLLFLGVGLTILWFLYHSLNENFLEDCASKGIPQSECSLIDKVWQDLKSAKIGWLIIITLCFVFSNVCRAWRWQQFTSSLGYATRYLNGFHCIMLGYFANLGFPRIGEVVRAGTFAQYEKIPFEKVVGTVALDRILDLICLLIVFLLALLFESDTLWSYISKNASFDIFSVLVSGWFMAIVFLMSVALFVCYRYWQSIKKFKVFQKIADLIVGFMDGLSSIKKIKNLPFLLFNSISIWLMYYLMTYLCFNAFEPTSHLGPLAGLMVFVFGSLGMVIPSPGGMGTFHALVIAGLALYGIGTDDAFSFAMIIFFTINIFGNVLLGIIALILLPGYNLGYEPLREDV